MTSSSPHRPLIAIITAIRSSLPFLFLSLLLIYLIYSSQLLINPPHTKISCQDYSNLNTNTNTTTTTTNNTNPQITGYNTELKHIAFCIAASSKLWDSRKEYIKLWWRPGETRGAVWLDNKVKIKKNESQSLPNIHISQPTSRFPYTNRQGHRSAIRISRIVSEALRLGLEDVRWFVMGDDDTVFVVENVVRVLNKYNHNQFYYIGSSSESHFQNIFFSYSMAYGGGGFAISYPLVKELAKMQDRCIKRYPGLYGSDDRMQACMSELNVPLTKEPGFHQNDVYGNLLGLLSGHQVTPLVSLHHFDVIDPIFPGMERVESLKHLLESTKYDSASLIQQSICYDTKREWSILVSWGFAIQITRGILSPRELETPSRTFVNWYKVLDFTAYAFNTRPVTHHPCQTPFVFYINSTRYDESRRQIIGIYSVHRQRQPKCRWKMASPEKIHTVVVLKHEDPDRWLRAPRKDCCRVLPSRKEGVMYLWVGHCGENEVIEV
ncbi:putative N-acetylgalactosaminide beta-1,3-galactosyltransferase [Helianthus debilis subsp. tardiflorus]